MDRTRAIWVAGGHAGNSTRAGTAVGVLHGTMFGHRIRALLGTLGAACILGLASPVAMAIGDAPTSTVVVPTGTPTSVATPGAKVPGATPVENPPAPTLAPAASVPTVAPTIPVATVRPGAAASPVPASAPWRWRARTIGTRDVTGNPTTCATTITVATDTCPVTMSLVATNRSAPTTTFRVGDVAEVQVRLVTAATVTFNAVQVALEFDAADLRPVDGPVSRATLPVTADGSTDSRVVQVGSGTFGQDATILRDAFTISGTGATSGRVRLDAGVGLPTTGAPSPVELVPGTPLTIGTTFLRVMRNPDADGGLALTLRDSSGDGNRYGLVAIVEADDAGFNVLGPVKGTTLAVARTTTGARLAIPTPASGSVRRVGDLVPVSVVLDTATPLRNARTVRATIGYDPTRLGLVTSSTGNSPPFAATGTFAPDLGGSALGAGATASATNTFAIEGVATGTVKLTIDGAALDLAAGTPGAMVATLHFRALDRGDLSLSLDAVEVGELEPGTAGTGLATSPVGYAIHVDPVAGVSVPGVRGSVGVAVTVAGSPLAGPDGLPVPLSLGGVPTGTFTVTDGRYLDLEVTALAGGEDARRIDHAAIDVPLPAGLSLPADTASSSFSVLGPGMVADGAMAVATSESGGVTMLSVRVARAASGTFDAPAPLARVRLAVASGTFTSTTGTVVLAIAQSTSLTHSGTRYVNNLHDSSTADGPLDALPAVTRQAPASISVPIRLQGRAAADPAARYVQAVDAFLATPGATAAATRHATVATPVALATTAAATMQYRAETTRGADGADGKPVAALALPDLDPGTYDLFLKGRSSLRARVARVTLQAGENAVALAAPVTLLEGDGDRSDAINIGDFVVLATSYATAAPVTGDTADFNQSGYIDAFDFSLLARNYGVRGPVTLATLALQAPVPTTLATGTTTTATFTLTIPPGETLTQARVSITADPRLGLGCAANQAPGTACTPDGAARVTLVATPAGGATGTFTLGTVTLAPVEAGLANLTATLVEAKGTDSAGLPSTYRSPSPAATIAVDPDATFAVSAVATNGGDALDATITFVARQDVKVTTGTFRLAFDPAVLSASGGDGCPLATGATLPAGVTCAATAGAVTFWIDAHDGLAGTTTIGPVAFAVAAAAPDGTHVIHLGASGLADGATAPTFLARNLVVAPTTFGDADASFTTLGGTVTTGAMQTNRVRARVARPATGAWLEVPDGPVAPGSVVPVTIRLAAASPVDAVQLVVRPGTGFAITGADGRPVTGGEAFRDAPASPLPVALRRALDALAGTFELAFGRPVGGGVASVVGDAVLGTVYLAATGTGGTWPAIELVEAGSGRFVALASGPDGPVLASLTDRAWLDVDAGVAPSMPSGSGTGAADSEASGLATFIGPPAPGAPTDGGTGTAPRATAAPPRAGESPRTATGATPGTPFAAGIRTDRARGTVTIDLPGRPNPVTFAAGLASTSADAWCDGPRYRTYLRLEDTGITGATFGLGADGALAWVPPAQAGCVDWGAINAGGRTFTKDTIMRFPLATAAPGALLWVLDGGRTGELFEVDGLGIARYVTAAHFVANQDHFREAWANVIPVSSAQVDGLAVRGLVR